MSGNEEEKPIETPQTPAEAVAQPEKEPEYISSSKVKSAFTRVRSIEVRGGDLVVRYTDQGITLTGNARLVYTGEMEY